MTTQHPVIEGKNKMFKKCHCQVNSLLALLYAYLLYFTFCFPHFVG